MGSLGWALRIIIISFFLTLLKTTLGAEIVYPEEQVLYDNGPTIVVKGTPVPPATKGVAPALENTAKEAPAAASAPSSPSSFPTTLHPNHALGNSTNSTSDKSKGPPRERQMQSRSIKTDIFGELVTTNGANCSIAHNDLSKLKGAVKFQLCEPVKLPTKAVAV